MSKELSGLYSPDGRKYRVYASNGELADEVATFEKATWSAKDFRYSYGWMAPLTIYGYDVVGEDLKNKTKLLVVN